MTKVRSLRGSRAGYACTWDRGPTPPTTSLFAYFFLMAQPRQFSKCRECFRKLFGSGDCSNLVPWLSIEESTSQICLRINSVKAIWPGHEISRRPGCQIERKGSSEGTTKGEKSGLFPALSVGRANGTVVFGIRYSVDRRMLK